jgi:hypothetical protein
LTSLCEINSPRINRSPASQSRKEGVIAHEQLLAAGLSPQAVERRVRAGRLHTIHRGVFAVGHALLGADGRWWAAILALGEDAFVSQATTAPRTPACAGCRSPPRARTLLDLAASGLRGEPLLAALDQAEQLRLVDFAELHELLAHLRALRRTRSTAATGEHRH